MKAGESKTNEIVSPFSMSLSRSSNPASLKDDSRLLPIFDFGGPLANTICMMLVMRVLAEKRESSQLSVESRAQRTRRSYAHENNAGKKGEFKMAEHEKPQDHFFTGFFIGSLLGALAGIFFAPKSGRELRSDIKEKGSEVLKEGKEIYVDAGTKAREIIEEAKHQAKELKKEADRYLSDARQRAKEISARGKKREAEAGESEQEDTGGREV